LTLLLSKDIYVMGSRANSSYKSVGIKYIKYYFLHKIHLQHNSGVLKRKLAKAKSPPSIIEE